MHPRPRIGLLAGGWPTLGTDTSAVNYRTSAGGHGSAPWSHVVRTPAMDREKLLSLFDLTGRLAIVTGGARGIGRAIGEGLLSCGAKVAIASRKADACETAAKELSSLGEVLGVPTHMGHV